MSFALCSGHFNSPAHLSRRLIGELIVCPGIRRPLSIRRPSTFSNDISEAMKPVLTVPNFTYSIYQQEGVGEGTNNGVCLCRSDKNSGCYGNLQLPLTCNGKNETSRKLLRIKV